MTRSAPCSSGRQSTGRRERVVDHEPGARVVRGGGGGGQIGDRPAGVGRRLRPDDPRGARPQRQAQGGHVAGGHEVERDPLPRRLILQPAAEHPVHLLRRDDVVADVERLEHGGGRRHPGAEQHRRASPFERRQQRLGLLVGRVLVTGIDAPAGGLAFRRPFVLHGGVHGRHERAGRPDRPSRAPARRASTVSGRRGETGHAGTSGTQDCYELSVRGRRGPRETGSTGLPYARAGPMSTAMSRHLPWRKRSTLRLARIMWPSTMASQMSGASSPRVISSQVQSPIGTTTCEIIEI